MRTKLTGKITLQEDVEIIKESKIDNTFVLHIPNPLKTYYSRFTSVNRPNSVLFITKNSISNEQVLRANTRVNEENNLNLTAAKTRLKINNQSYTGFRVKGIDRFSNIKSIQELFANEGFIFDKSRAYKDEVNALIRITKFFDLETLESGIYKSLKSDDSYIIEIPKALSWNEFRNITFDIKSRISSSSYDVVKGVLYDDGRVIDILRVMKPGFNIQQLKEIQQMYWEKMTDLSFIDNLI